jgi:hypothetical protein
VFGRLGFIGIVALAMVVLVSQSGGSDAAPTIAQSCPGGSAAGVTVSFVWPPAAEGATETYLDIGLNRDFTEASYQGYGPFDPTQTAYALAALPEGVKYHYRVQSRAADSWHVQAKGTFTTACGAPPVPRAATQRCTEGPLPGDADDSVTATFSWNPGAQGEQWIDLSTGGEDFAPGTYQGYGPAHSGAETFEVAGIARGVTYWWRVNVRTPGGWITSPAAIFASLPCPRAG